MKKRIFALLLCAVFALSFTACAATPEDARKVLESAMENVNQAESMSYGMELAASMEIAGQAIDMNYLMDIDSIMKPSILLRISMTMEFYNALSATVTSYVEQNADGSFTAYSTVDGYSWERTETPSALQYDAAGMMDSYMDNLEEIRHVGTERIEGRVADRYDCTIRREYFEEAFGMSGMDSLFDILPASFSAEDFYNSLGDLKFTIWIDRQAMLPVKYSIDMRDVMQEMYNKLLSAAGVTDSITISTLSTTVTFRDINNVAPFEVPAEAKQ